MESGKENPYSCAVLAGGRQQRERQANLEGFKDGDVRFLICTDVAARGIDIAGLPFVVQMTLPDDIENYIHRIGRCGRADRMGLAISLIATAREKVWYHKKKNGQAFQPSTGDTKLTIPFGPDGNLLPRDDARWRVEEEGDATWYDEPELLERTQARAGGRIQVMDPEDFSVSGVLESPLPEELRKNKKISDEDMDTGPPSRRALKRKQEVTQTVVYGAKKKDTSLATAAKQVSAIAPVVSQLTDLEVRVQHMFARMMWGSWAGDMSARGGKARTDIQVAALNPVAAAAAAAAASVIQTPKKPASAVAAGEKPKKKMRW